MLAGATIGAGGVLYWQQQGPRRLTLAESAVFYNRAERAEAELRRTTQELEDLRRNLQAAQDAGASALSEAQTARKRTETLEQDLALMGQLLPPDPRGGPVGVRTVRFTTEGAAVGWTALLTREAATPKRAEGLIEIAIAGRNASGREEVVKMEPTPIVFEGAYLRAQGHVALPDQFVARRATVRVLDKPDGKLLGMRIFNLR